MKNFLSEIILWICFLGFASGAIAQPKFAVPAGVWCSCPPTTGTGYGSVLPTVAAKAYVKGILVRVVWKDLEPTDDTYNWTLIDDQITAAKSFGKKISLAVGGGPNSPAWLYTLGAQSISATVPIAATIPIPWDSIFLKKWTELVADLSNRYQNDTTIQLVYMTNSSGNGFEMQLPFSPTPSYASIGFSDGLVISSWKKVIDQFNAGFPNHYLSNDFHPVNSSDAIADSVYNYATSTIGSRYGANAWWWTQNNTTVYAAQYAILKNSAANNAFTGLQMAASGIKSAATFGAGGMPAALDLAIKDNVCYWEIWNSDLVDGSFDSLLSKATCAPLSIKDLSSAEANLGVFPNPTSGMITIEMGNQKIQKLALINEFGQIIFRQDNINTQRCQLNISQNNAGLYILKLMDTNGNILFRKLTKLASQ